MKKYLRYSWLMIIVIIPVFLNFSKTEQDIFTVVSSSDLDSVKQEIDKKPALLNHSDKNGFTLYDYAVLNENPDVRQWMLSQKISSGVSQNMIERIRLWFLLIGVPVNSQNFNLQGIYDRGLEEAILNYQTTRGLDKQQQITPDWYMDLEEEGVRFLQELLFEADSDKITGHWNPESDQALKDFQKSAGLSETGHLSLADIVALKKAYANTIDQYIGAKSTGVLISDTDTNVAELKTIQPVISDEIVSSTIEVEPEVKNDVQEAIETEVVSEVVNASGEAMTPGFLIDSNAVSGKLLNLQVWLTLAGFPAGTLDGQMGPSTRQAIKDFESSIGLKPTGIMSAKWETPLERIIWKKVQEKLEQLELYDQAIDGIAGASTIDALKSYEESSGLTVNGSLLPETLSMLFNEGQMFNDGSMDEAPVVNIDHGEEDGIIVEEGDDETVEVAEILPEDAPVVEEISSEETMNVAGFNPEGIENTVKLQLMLALLGMFNGEVNGHSDAELVESVKLFQSQNNLGVDGKVGRQTQNVLDAQVITKIQRYLNDKDLLEDAPTGTLGPKTRKIIIQLRKDHKLPEADPTQLDIGILLIVLGDANKQDYVKTYLDVLEKQRIQKQQIQDSQEYLTALGYFNGKIDGMQGKSTNDALVKFKKEHKLPANEELTDDLFKTFKTQTIKRVQSELSKLGYKLKADGLTGPTTKKTIETFQKRYSYKVTGEPDLATLHQVNARVVANSRRTPASSGVASSVANNQPVRGVMPTMGAKGAQGERVLTAAPQAIVGRMSMIHNSQGVLSGCKVNNISISAAMCGSARNNQQCRIVYRKGRVLSVSCRG